MSSFPQDEIRVIAPPHDGVKMRAGVGEGHNASKYTGIAGREQALRLLASGMTMKDVARTIGLSLQHMSKMMAQPEMQQRLKELNAEVYAELDAELKFRAKTTHEKLNAAADEALDKVIDLMRGADSEVIQFKAATDLMDRRADTSKVHRIDKRQVNVNIDSKWLELAAKAEQEETGQVVEGV